MISKYFLWTSGLILGILLFSACLDSSDNEVEYSSDPQIYAISASSDADTLLLLPSVTFTIDQVNGRIFNEEPLPYLFHVDSALLSISGSNNYYSFAKIELTLDTDCTYTWESGSIDINRLREIEITAPDGVTSKNYKFQLNIYREDPYIIIWDEMAGNWLTSPVESQKTIAYKGLFITYSRDGAGIKAVSSAISESPEWKTVSLSGIPSSIHLSSLTTTEDFIYALDAASGLAYRSVNGSNWSLVQTEYEIKALYGELPTTASKSKTLLLAVNHEGKLKFALSDNDLSGIELMNDAPSNIPVTDFSAITVESSTSYASKFIFLSGGTASNNAFNNDIWLLQENGENIQYITSEKPAEAVMEGSSLFFYDDKPYVIASSAGKSALMYSDNYGASWVFSEENQALPESFGERTTASVVTDTNNNIWIFGGISSSNAQFADIWKGRLNKFALN